MSHGKEQAEEACQDQGQSQGSEAAKAGNAATKATDTTSTKATTPPATTPQKGD